MQPSATVPPGHHAYWQPATSERGQAADERDRAADERDHIADQRDQIADRREHLADQREHLADQRDEAFGELLSRPGLDEGDLWKLELAAATRTLEKLARAQAEERRAVALRARNLAGARREQAREQLAWDDIDRHRREVVAKARVMIAQAKHLRDVSSTLRDHAL